MNNKELKLLHNKILELADYFDSFCKENNIVYYLMGGTALGAVRHSGFIPWDDDFDVFMDRENYLKFLAVAKYNLNTDKYYFQEENTKEFPLYFSKIRMNNTTFIEKDVVGREMHHGVYIDVMCLNETSSFIFVRYLLYLSARILSAKALSEKGYITTSKLKKTLLFVVKYFIPSFFAKELLRFVRSFNGKDTQLIGHFFGRAPFNRTSFKKSFLGKARYIRFNSLNLPVPEFVEEYLIVRYGKRYNELPSENEKMRYPSHAFIVDTTKSYKEYMNIDVNR
jgi:lipopolysaccharide cholinephosphotransferase